MTTAGHPNPESTDDDEGSIGWLPVLIGVAALVIALVVGSQVVSAVYSLLFLPQAPVPANATLISATQQGYGSDTYHYQSMDSACAVIDYYQAQGATCASVVAWCQNVSIDQLPPEYAYQTAATCSQMVPFSAFGMLYRVEIRTGSLIDFKSEFYLEREILWSGIPATATPTPVGTPAPTPTITPPPQFGSNR